MATNNITTTYVGKDSGAFISPTLKAGVTWGTPLVTIHNNVNYKSRITALDLDGILKGASCDFDSVGTINQTEVWLNVKKFQVNLSVCKNDYYADFIGENTGAWGPLNNGAFLRYFMAQVGADIADALEVMTWQGSDGADAFNGFETLFAADAAVLDVATPVAITADNAISEFRRGTAVLQANVPQLFGYSDLYCYMGSQYFQAIREANNDKNSASPCGEECIAVDGIQIKHVPGMTSDAYAITRMSNLHAGTWTSSDLNRVALIDQEPLDGSDNMNFVMKFFAGVQHAYGSEVVFYAGGGV